MEDHSTSTFPPGYSYPATAVYFLLGGLVTAVFSGSLAMLTSKASFFWVLLVGMVVPSFTWVVQLSASGLLLDARARQLYWGDLGRICLCGSFALLPAAIVNLVVPNPSLAISVGNVLFSVAIMAADLFRRSALHGRSIVWPISWCLTITVNMTLFVLSSWNWW